MHLAKLMELGARLEPHSYRNVAGRDEAIDRIRRWARRPGADQGLADWLVGTDGHLQRAAWAARWAHSGFPQIVVGHRLAASLMATSIPSDAAATIPRPWPAYLIVLPTGLVPVHDRVKGLEANADYVMVERDEGVSLLMAEVADTSFFLGNVGDPLVLQGSVQSDDENWQGHGDWRPEDRDARTLDLLWRLAAGVELELTDSTRVRAPRATARSNSAGRSAPEPTTRTYVLTRKVNVDCRDAVRKRILGERGSALSVQILVRGHWRQQPCGPERRDRKWMHIEAYWRGPEDAPIAVREHPVTTARDRADEPRDPAARRTNG